MWYQLKSIYLPHFLNLDVPDETPQLFHEKIHQSVSFSQVLVPQSGQMIINELAAVLQFPFRVLTAFCFEPRSGFGSGESSPSEKQILTIYDLDNKFIAYSACFDDVVDVVAEWGSFYILTRDGKMFVLQEKDTQTKLEVSSSL